MYVFVEDSAHEFDTYETFCLWSIIILILRRAGQYNIYKVPELNEAVNDKGLKK